MITHFQFKELANNFIRREWGFSFNYEGQYITGKYYKNGKIDWNHPLTDNQIKILEPRIHDLMLYHVYEK